jgi:glycosyltransferase involved in cell wall biosynthesis
VRLVPPSAYSMREVLEASRVAVAIYSTSLLEAAAAGTPALSFNTTSLPRYSPDIEEHGVGIETREIEAALGAIDSLLHDDARHASFGPALDRFGARFFAGADGSAPERIVALVDELTTA